MNNKTLFSVLFCTILFLLFGFALVFQNDFFCNLDSLCLWKLLNKFCGQTKTETRCYTDTENLENKVALTYLDSSERTLNHIKCIQDPNQFSVPATNYSSNLFHNVMMKWNKSQCLQENYLQMLLPLLQVPQQRLTKVSTQQGTSVWPMCSLPQGEWESPAPVEQQEYIVRSKETQQVTTTPIF